MTLGMLDSGEFLNITVIPKDLKSKHYHHWEGHNIMSAALEAFSDVRARFTRALRNVSGLEMQRLSIQENSLSNPSAFMIHLPDQAFILELLDNAVKEADPGPEGAFLITLSKFGQRSRSTYDLGRVTEITNVQAISVQYGYELYATGDSQTHFVWARKELEEWVGRNGALLSAVGLSEAAEFESALDGRVIDLSEELMAVLKGGRAGATGVLNYVHIYTTSPRTQQQRPAKHPVSGVMACCEALHPNTTAAMHARALEFMDHITDTSYKFQTTLAPRIEQVSLLHTKHKCQYIYK